MEDVESKSDTSVRLMISHMDLVNFKSYFGTQTIGPFHKCFSSVVGPNGSGKSNVIDAMLFVFGYRASKIRQGKLSGLIHNSESHQNVPSCSVSVYFQQIVDTDGDNFDVVPNSEVVVKREARRDNTSTYYYNGKKMVFKELAQELRRLGIDLDHNRFLILQGEVEAISMMPPKGKTNEKGDTIEEGMLEYLEDIIGSNQFITPIQELDARVEELNADRGLKLGNVKIVEKEKDTLEAGKEEAESFLIQENEIIVQKNELYQCYKYQCERNSTEAGERLSAAQARADAAKKTLQEKEAEMENVEKAHAEDLAEYKNLKEAADTAKAQFTVYERRDVKLRQNDADAKKKCEKIKKSIAKDESKINECTGEVTVLEEDIVKYNDELSDKESTLVKEEKKLSAIMEEGMGEKAALKEKLDAKQKELVPYTAAVNEVQSAFDIQQQELDLLTANARSLTQQLTEAQGNLRTAANTESERTDQIHALETRQQTVATELTAAQQELKRLTQQEGPLAETVREKRAKVEEAKSSASSQRSQSKVFQTLMSLGREGVYGRLGSLGAIDDKYDCAVTTACPQLNYLVVDKVSTAQHCIDYLKKHNIGRVTAICLDKQQRLESAMQREFQAPAGTDRLFDLVRVKDDKFKLAFYYALRDTLVADNLDLATKVAFASKTKKHRVVTRQGQVIDVSGTMSGGGNKAQKGGMSAKLASDASALGPKEIAKLEKSLDGDVEVLTQQRKRRDALETTVSTLTKESSSFNTQYKKLNMDIASAKKAIPELEQLITELEAKQAASKSDDTAKIAKLEAALSKCGAKLAKAKQDAGKIEAQIAAIEKEIDDVGGVPLRAQKAKVKSLNEQMELLRSKITKANVNIKTSKATIKKTTAKIEKDTAELTAAKELRETIKAELAEMDQSALAVMQQYEEANKILKDKDAEMKKISKEHAKLENETNKLRSNMIDLDENVKTMAAVVKENNLKMRSWQSKIGKLKLHKIGSDYFDDEDDSESDADMAADPDGDAAPKKKSKKFELTAFSEDHLETIDCEKLEYDISILEQKMGTKKINTKAIKDYYEKEEEYINKVAELDKITELRDGVRAEYEELRKKRLDCFFAGFKVISTKLKEMYQMITLGGDAELEYVDNINPFSEGIVFSVRPPRKSWKAIQNLSGGEKTLSSLALVFALHHYKPTPLYVMDEIDAALDFKNVSIVAHYIKERTKNAQFIIISLRNNMFELADRLVGIYKTDNCTKTVTINPHAMAGMALSSAEEAAPPASAVKVHPAAARPTPIRALASTENNIA
eukprot:m.1458495 g.1458495  ORF g.1458495 m.1458495 type:complete len:1290 (+) comp25122_c0_seq1:152-4021(+)